MAGSSKDGKESSGFVKGKEFDDLNDYQLFESKSALFSYLREYLRDKIISCIHFRL